ncbi:MAG: hypothetical protein H0T57_10815 [Rubrobacter sp.]|nr:hypothetical protein [Rubrobacter sp.]MDQ3639081.1 hypothetical protein [Actinomycetota bacterium]
MSPTLVEFGSIFCVMHGKDTLPLGNTTSWSRSSRATIGAMLALASSGLTRLVLGRSGKLWAIHLTIGGAFYLANVLEGGPGRRLIVGEAERRQK